MSSVSSTPLGSSKATVTGLEVSQVPALFVSSTRPGTGQAAAPTSPSRSVPS